MSLEIIAASVVGLAAVWLILQPLVAPGRERAATYEPPDPEDTPKGVALAALKEIEFDRETGKLSDEDYAFLKAKYTGAALEALRAEAPETAAGGDVEVLIAARVRALRSAATSAPPGAPSCSVCGPRPEADAVFCSSCGQRLREGGACAGCGATLSADSRYCTQCGAGVAA